MPLIDTAIKNAKSTPDKDYKLKPSEQGMYVLVHKNGGKYFRLDYRFNGKRKTLALGTYPETTLKQAREKRDTAKKKISDGIYPAFERKMKKLGATENSFQAIALEWYEKNMSSKSEGHKSRALSYLNNDLFPWIAGKPIAEVKAPELLAALRLIEGRNAHESAHRALSLCGQIFRYAGATGRLERDVSQSLKGALTPVNSTNFAAITEPAKVKPLLKAIDAYSGSFVVKSALQLAPLVFVRPGELRQAEWEHINFDTKEWRYCASKTKVQHIVPLSRQAIKILTDLHPLTGHGRFVFPSERTPNGSRAMSDMALLTALQWTPKNSLKQPFFEKAQNRQARQFINPV